MLASGAMRNRPWPAFVFAVVAAALAPLTAHAGRIAVLAPQLKPPGAAELRDRFHDSAVQGIAKAGEVVSAAEVRDKLASRPDLLNCVSGGCIAGAAAALGAERIVTMEVEYVGKDYSIRIHAFDAAILVCRTLFDSAQPAC